MTDEQRAFLSRINKYAESTLGDIDPQKTPVSMQLNTLKPIMQQIADEKGLSLTDVFIMYMDLQSEASVATENKLKEDLKDLNEGDGMPMLFR